MRDFDSEPQRRKRPVAERRRPQDLSEEEFRVAHDPAHRQIQAQIRAAKVSRTGWVVGPYVTDAVPWTVWKCRHRLAAKLPPASPRTPRTRSTARRARRALRRQRARSPGRESDPEPLAHNAGGGGSAEGVA